MYRIAVLLTCHNRRQLTLECLEALFRQKMPETASIEVFLVDDGSTDATGDAVKQQFPSVNVIYGSGKLYWCGGMRLAWNVAMQQDFDFYLWLNDDTILFADALTIFLEAVNTVSETSKYNGIVVGSTCHKDTGARTYGGGVQVKEKSFNFWPVVPSGSLEPCDTFNGNCVLVSRGAFRELGNLCQEYTHAIGDTDYGLRAKEKKIPMWVAPAYIGTCSNNATDSWMNNTLPLRKRIENLHNPKGLPPKEWIFFCRRHAGWKWPCNVIKVYIRVLAPRAWDSLKGMLKKNRMN